MRELATVSISPRRIGLLLLVFCCLFGLALVAAAGFLLFKNPFDDTPFNPTSWAKSGPVQRAAMADNLLAHYLPAGLPESEVRRLLGAPNDVYENRGVDYGGNALSGSYTLVYYIGSWSFEFRDSVFVYVHFNDDRCVFFAEIQGY